MSQQMPCETCGETEYHEEGGFFYCDQCNTQSQGMRVIEASADQFNLTGAQRSIYQKVDRTLVEKKEIDYGIPWTTHDAFGLLLQAQSVELVKLGASPTLPLLTEKLWKRYEERRAGTPLPRARDMTKDKSKGIPPISRWRASRKRSGKWPNSVAPELLSRGERIEWKIQNGVAPEEAEEEENQAEKERKEGDRKPSGAEEPIDKDTRNQLDIAGRTALEHIQRMRMEYSLCFMYIALLHMESHITLGDLHRWCVQCVVPYLNPLAYFPENMKFFDSDLKTFASVKCVPPPSQIRRDAGRLIVFLQLTPFPPVNLRQILSRLVLDLNLPAEILQLTSELMKIVKMGEVNHSHRRDDNHTITIPNYEAYAVTALLMTLKMIFRLDGVTEFLLSHFVLELETLPDAYLATPTNCTFCFKEWFQFATDALLKMKSREFPSLEEIEENDGDVSGGCPRDVSYLARVYSHNLVNRKGSERRRDLTSRDRIEDLEESLAELLLSDADFSAPHATNNVSSFPASAALGLEGVVVDDSLAETEWRRSLNTDAYCKTARGRGRAVIAPISAGQRLRERKLGILTDEHLQRDVVNNDMILLKLNMPAFEIDEEGYPTCEWTSAEASTNVEHKLETNKSCLERLFSHQSNYYFLVERQADKEKKRFGREGLERRRSDQLKDSVLLTSNTVGILIEFFARLIGQTSGELMLNIYQIERDFPVPCLKT